MPINAMQAAANNNKTSILCSTFHAEPKYVFKNSLLGMCIRVILRVIHPERFLTPVYVTLCWLPPEKMNHTPFFMRKPHMNSKTVDFKCIVIIVKIIIILIAHLFYCLLFASYTANSLQYICVLRNLYFS
jgi:hypothetical protein